MSKYGEVKDLVDNIKLYSNLRLRVYEDERAGDHSKQADTIRAEADELLEQIEKDLDNLVTDRIVSQHVIQTLSL
jgi:enamine deaminase RidA (YjgF/YER057c/UK114 family)